MGLFNSSWSKYQGPNCNSFCMPVRKRAGWSIWTWVPNNIEINPIMQFWWIPAGSNASSAQIVRTGESPVQKDMRAGSNRRVAVPKEHLIGELADLINSLAEKPIPQEKRNKLRELLTLMNTDSFIDE
jgi:hypothetical protein